MVRIVVTYTLIATIRTMALTHTDQVIRLAAAQGVIRSRDLASEGIPRTVLGRLVERGELSRVGRGLYRLTDADVTPHHSLVQVAVRVPGCTVNLLSALSFHELTDELPAGVWIAVPRGHRVPTLDSPRLELTWVAPALLKVGVTTHRIEGLDVAITDPARTVVDCFRHRSRVGVDVAIAALRDYLRRHRSGREELWQIAGVCRMQRVMRPYLESLS